MKYLLHLLRSSWSDLRDLWNPPSPVIKGSDTLLYYIHSRKLQGRGAFYPESPVKYHQTNWL